MKVYIYRKKTSSPIVITTNDKDINEIKNIIADSILKNKTLVVENGNEVMYVKMNDIDAIKIGNDIELTDDSLRSNKKSMEDLDLTIDVSKNVKHEKPKKSKKKKSSPELKLNIENNLEKKGSDDYSINID